MRKKKIAEKYKEKQRINRAANDSNNQQRVKENCKAKQMRERKLKSVPSHASALQSPPSSSLPIQEQVVSPPSSGMPAVPQFRADVFYLSLNAGGLADIRELMNKKARKTNEQFDWTKLLFDCV